LYTTTVFTMRHPAAAASGSTNSFAFTNVTLDGKCSAHGTRGTSPNSLQAIKDSACVHKGQCRLGTDAHEDLDQAADHPIRRRAPRDLAVGPRYCSVDDGAKRLLID